MAENFEGKVAFVTGTASGLGFATAKAFAEAGAAVALVDLDEDETGRAAGRIDGTTLAIACDISDEEAIRSAVERTVSELGRLDFAFNNAGVMVDRAETAEAATDEFDKTIAVNLRGVWLCMKFQLQHMEERGEGAIVNCSQHGR